MQSTARVREAQTSGRGRSAAMGPARWTDNDSSSIEDVKHHHGTTNFNAGLLSSLILSD